MEIYNLSKNVSISSCKYGQLGYYAIVVHNDMVPSKIIKKDDYSFIADGINYYLYDYTGESRDLVLPNDILGNQYIIHKKAFTENMKIKSVVIPNGVTSIGEGAFYHCVNLCQVDFPETLLSIGEKAFRYCDNLEEIIIPKKVRYIGECAFCGENLKRIIIDIDNEVYDSRNNCNAIIESSTNKLVTGCLETVIPSDILIIGEGAFCTVNFNSIIIPESVTSIEDFAFCSCENLISITIPPSVTKLSDFCFAWCDNLIEIKLPQTIKEIYFSAFDDCCSLTNIYFEGSEDDWNKIYVDNGNDILDKTNVYFYSYVSFDYEMKDLIRRNKVKYKIKLSDIPQTYDQALFEKNRYIICGKITHMSEIKFPKQECIFLRLAVKENDYIVHVRHLYKFEEDEERINFKVGDKVTHKKFGVGTIISIKLDDLTIQFYSNKKNIFIFIISYIFIPFY